MNKDKGLHLQQEAFCLYSFMITIYSLLKCSQQSIKSITQYQLLNICRPDKYLIASSAHELA